MKGEGAKPERLLAETTEWKHGLACYPGLDCDRFHFGGIQFRALGSIEFEEKKKWRRCRRFNLGATDFP